MIGLQSMRPEYGQGYQQNLDLQHTSLVTSRVAGEQTVSLVMEQESVQIVGQMRDSYIVLEGVSGVYRVDQHALAERITFEKMRKEIKEK
jgi:DNA mismatch repair ATPase MutL